MSNTLSTKIASKVSLSLVAFGAVVVMSVVGARPAMAKQHGINMWEACEYHALSHNKRLPIWLKVNVIMVT